MSGKNHFDIICVNRNVRLKFLNHNWRQFRAHYVTRPTDTAGISLHVAQAWETCTSLGVSDKFREVGYNGIWALLDKRNAKFYRRHITPYKHALLPPYKYHVYRYWQPTWSVCKADQHYNGQKYIRSSTSRPNDTYATNLCQPVMRAQSV